MRAQHRPTTKATVNIWETSVIQVFGELLPYSIDINTIERVWNIIEKKRSLHKSAIGDLKNAF